MSEQLPQLNVTHSRARKLTYTAACNARIEECQLADLKEKNVTIETLYSGISRGTESLVYHGKVPKSEEKRMQCPHQTGDFSYPVSYGYACVGKIIETQSDLSPMKTGDLVFVLHPHQDIFQVHEDACNLLPADISPARAVLCANMETALNAVWDAELGQSKAHMVIGAGVVGLLTAYCLKAISGSAPIVIDINPAKKEIAQKLGLNCMTPDAFTGSNSDGMERVFNTSASEQGLQFAIDNAAFEAKIIEMSWYGDKTVSLNLGGAFHSRRLQIISSQVGHVAPAKRDTHTYSDRMQQAMKLLDDPCLDALLEPEVAFLDLPNHLHDIFSNNSSALCQLVKYNNA